MNHLKGIISLLNHLNDKGRLDFKIEHPEVASLVNLTSTFKAFDMLKGDFLSLGYEQFKQSFGEQLFNGANIRSHADFNLAAILNALGLEDQDKIAIVVKHYELLEYDDLIRNMKSSKGTFGENKNKDTIVQKIIKKSDSTIVKTINFLDEFKFKRCKAITLNNNDHVYILKTTKDSTAKLENFINDKGKNINEFFADSLFTSKDSNLSLRISLSKATRVFPQLETSNFKNMLSTFQVKFSETVVDHNSKLMISDSVSKSLMKLALIIYRLTSEDIVDTLKLTNHQTLDFCELTAFCLLITLIS